MRIAVAGCVYGNHYVPLALSWLEAWGEFVPHIYLLCSDMDEQTVLDLRRAYPSVRILTRPAKLARRSSVRIAQKTLFWEHLGRIVLADGYDFAIYADADTVAVRDPRPLCRADVVVTRREPGARYYLNTGVMALSRAALAAGFLKEWRERTQAITADPGRLATANSKHEPYGAPDQMAMIEQLGLHPGATAGAYPGLSVEIAECEEFNACGNVIDAGRARVLHLKSSLHRYLLDGRPLIGGRKVEDSSVQLSAATRRNAQAKARLAAAGVPPDRLARAFSFRLPPGARADFTVPASVELRHRAVSRVKATLSRWLRRVLRAAA